MSVIFEIIKDSILFGAGSGISLAIKNFLSKRKYNSQNKLSKKSVETYRNLPDHKQKSSNIVFVFSMTPISNHANEHKLYIENCKLENQELLIKLYNVIRKTLDPSVIFDDNVIKMGVFTHLTKFTNDNILATLHSFIKNNKLSYETFSYKSITCDLLKVDSKPTTEYYDIKTQKYHRDEEDGPAYIDENEESYYKFGKLHRENGPARITEICQRYFINGSLQKEVFKNRTLFYKNGELTSYIKSCG